MIYAITAINFRGESLRMELSHPEKSGLVVRSVDGIGAGQANINLSDMATTDGGKFNSARLTSRNITLVLKPMTIPSVEENRHKTYRIFPTKKPISLIFETDSGLRRIEGYTETNDPDIFSNLETCQISILCPDPYFYDTDYTTMTLSGYESMFEFPFSNESLTENLIIFDNLKYLKRVSFVYHGEADTGVILNIHAKGDARKIKFYAIEADMSMLIDTDKFPSVIGNKIQSSDDIFISTYLGDRTAYLVRDGIRYNIINSLGRNAEWFNLIAGVNTFSYTAVEGENLLDVTLKYRNIYEGV